MVEATLNRLYYSLSQPTALSSAQRIYKEVKKRHAEITYSDVEKWLQNQDAYTLHRRARRKLSAEPRVHVRHIDEQWCIDLCDMVDVAKDNGGYRYILTCIDVLSKYAWAEPTKTKNANAVADAMQKILKSTSRQPMRIESDKGKEFHNSVFSTMLKSLGIHHFSTNSRHKASVVERFNRTLKQLLYRSFTATNTNKWVNVLQDALATYNGRIHRSIGMAPSSVNIRNEKLIYRRLYKKKPPAGKLLKKGQLVRLSKIRRTFEKGYLPSFTEEVFKIDRVITGRPHRYELIDLMNEKVEGKFVSEELTPVIKNANDVWRIEKVISRDNQGRFFVKWKGFPDKFNSWVNDIILPV